jgi:tRNA(fMet)-specific endonuclease VapC
MRYLLDTNIISDLVRNPQGRIADRIRQVGQTRICTSIIVACELRYGISKRGSRRLSEQVEAILAAIDVLPFEVPADAAYGVSRAGLEAKGSTIGGNDLLIAAHAVALGYVIVTGKDREFGRIDGLECENWLRDD